MRLRTLGIGIIALLVFGTSTAGAVITPRPKLWLLTNGETRATPGEAAKLQLNLSGGPVNCEVRESGSLLTNGREVDKFAFGAAAPVYEGCNGEGSQAIAGPVKYVALTGDTAQGPGTVTFFTQIRVLTPPWCVYKLPRFMPYFSGYTESSEYVAGPLAPRASVAGCEPAKTFLLHYKISVGASEGNYLQE